MDNSSPCLSFIGIVDFSEEAKWLYMTSSVSDLLGYEPHELVGRPSLELVHPDEFPRVKQLHYDTIRQDKAAVLVYLRMRHKNPDKGYVLCGISRTVVHNVLVGSVSFASPGAKALHNASTAQEITVITPSAANFEFRRWNDPSPMPTSPVSSNLPTPSSPASSSSSWSSPSPTSPASPRSPRRDSESRSPEPILQRQDAITFDHLPNQSLRTLFILDRFSSNNTIMYCSNDLLLTTMSAIGRSFFDFVIKKDEETVRSWIDCVKGWGVNERGQPSDGGFGFGRFTLLTKGRDSITRVPEPPPSRQRTSKSRGSRTSTRPSMHALGRPHIPTEPQSPQISVDAIFSAHSDGLMVILRRSS